MRTLNSKVLLLMVVGLLSTIVVVGYFGFVFVRSAIQESISSNQLQVARTTMEQIDRVLYTRLLNIQVVASNAEIINVLAVDEQQAVQPATTRLRSLRSLTGPWDVLRVLDTGGDVVLSSRGRETDMLMTDSRLKSLVQETLSGTVTHSDLITILDSNRKTVVFAAPIRAINEPGQRVIGVAVGHFAWPTILQILEDLEFHAMLISNTGVVIGANTQYGLEDVTGKNFEGSEAVRNVLGGDSLSLVLSGNDGFTDRSMLASLAPQLGFLDYQGNRWGLVVETPTDVAFASATQEAMKLVGLLAFMLTIFVGAILFLLRRLVVRPIALLTKTAQAIAGGDLSAQAKVSSRDEVGILAGTFNNMTDKLKRQITELKELDRLKDNFLNNTTHELKTPLIPIKSQTQLLLGEDYGKLNKDQKQAIEMILRNETHLENLVSDVVDITKIRTGKLRLVLKEAYLSEIITMAVGDMEELAKEKGIQLTLNPIPELPKLSLDEKRITQVVGNLLNNALKFTPKGGKVQVSVEKKAKEIEVRVQDTGIGMSKETLKKLFTPFFQAESNKDRKYGGTGLGLSICKGMTEAHGGTIKAESVGEGKGSALAFTLPIQNKGRHT